jgi:hypothetical protein
MVEQAVDHPAGGFGCRHKVVRACPSIGSVSVNHYLFDATDVDAQIGDYQFQS